MQLQVQELSPVLMQVKAEVPWEQLREDLNERFERAARVARVRGFRPGKAPLALVRQVYGDSVRKDSLSSWMKQALLLALNEHGWSVLAEPRLHAISMNDGEALQFTAELEVKPRIDHVDLSTLRYRLEPIVIKDEDVEDVLLRVRHRNALLSVPEPMRPAQDGDRLHLRVSGGVDGSRVKLYDRSELDIDLGLPDSSALPDEARQSLYGRVPSEEPFELVFQANDDQAGSLWHGRTMRFEVTVMQLHVLQIPELDDAFAKDCGHESVDEMRQAIRQQLQQSAEEAQWKAVDEQLYHALVDANPVTVPPSTLQQSLQKALMQRAIALQTLGQPWDAPIEEEQLAGMRQSQTRLVQLGLLLDALAKMHGLSIGDEDIEAHLQTLAAQTGLHLAKLRAHFQGEERAQLKAKLMQEKLRLWLRGQAQPIPAENG